MLHVLDHGSSKISSNFPTRLEKRTTCEWQGATTCPTRRHALLRGIASAPRLSTTPRSEAQTHPRPQSTELRTLRRLHSLRHQRRQQLGPVPLSYSQRQGASRSCQEPRQRGAPTSPGCGLSPAGWRAANKRVVRRCALGLPKSAASARRPATREARTAATRSDGCRRCCEAVPTCLPPPDARNETRHPLRKLPKFANKRSGSGRPPRATLRPLRRCRATASRRLSQAATAGRPGAPLRGAMPLPGNA